MSRSGERHWLVTDARRECAECGRVQEAKIVDGRALVSNTKPSCEACGSWPMPIEEEGVVKTETDKLVGGIVTVICLVLIALGVWHCQRPAHASGNSECHDHCCYDPMPGCVASKWEWFAARDRRCTPADGADTHGKAFLCYYDDAGEPQRFKFWGLVPLAEAEFEAEMRNAARCRR
jgi:hypothetical protein